MGRKIKVSSIYEEKPEPIEEEEPDEAPSEISEPVETTPEPTPEEEVESEYSSDDDPIVIPTKPKPTKKPMLDMPTTSKVLEQVACQACGKKCRRKP